MRKSLPIDTSITLFLNRSGTIVRDELIHHFKSVLKRSIERKLTTTNRPMIDRSRIWLIDHYEFHIFRMDSHNLFKEILENFKLGLWATMSRTDKSRQKFMSILSCRKTSALYAILGSLLATIPNER